MMRFGATAEGFGPLRRDVGSIRRAQVTGAMGSVMLETSSGDMGSANR